MRQIKFRAWDGEKMVEVAELHLNTKEILVDDEAWLSMRHSPLMQYTGQKDNNGREIYEDDIVRVVGVTEPGMKWVVTWANASWELHHVLGEEYMIPMRLSTMSVPIEVIGNIYENPELMEVAEHDAD